MAYLFGCFPVATLLRQLTFGGNQTAVQIIHLNCLLFELSFELNEECDKVLIRSHSHVYVFRYKHIIDIRTLLTLVELLKMFIS